MEKPIELLKNKLAELTSLSTTKPEILIEYKKAILILELMESDAFDDIMNKPTGAYKKENCQNDFEKESKSYYDRFMEAQKKKKKG